MKDMDTIICPQFLSHSIFWIEIGYVCSNRSDMFFLFTSFGKNRTRIISRPFWHPYVRRSDGFLGVSKVIEICWACQHGHGLQTYQNFNSIKVQGALRHHFTEQA